MIFRWVDYCEKYEDEIETWNDDEAVKRYVIAEGTKQDFLMYLSDERFKEYEYNKGYFCKVVLEEGKTIAIVMVFRGENIATTIEHFIVNRQYRNKGYGTKIINELISHASEIIGFDDICFESGHAAGNEASKMVWIKCGFTLWKTHSDGDHFYYPYTKKQHEQ